MNATTTAPSFDVQTVLDALTGWSDVEARLLVDDGLRMMYGHWSYMGSSRYSESFLLRAARHPRPLYRIVAVEYGAEFESVVTQGLRDRFWRVRWTAAKTQVAPPDLLAALVHDTSAMVRSAAAGNAATPLPALRAFLEDRVADVRQAAARNEALLASDLRQLSQHADWEVRRIVAARSDTPVDVLEALALDDDLAVAEAVGRNGFASSVALHRVVRRTSNTWTLEHIAVHPRTPVEDLLHLIDRGDPSVLMTMAKRSPAREALHRLAQMDDALLRAAVLTNPALTAASLKVMPLDAPVAEHRAAAAHPNASWATCRRLAQHYLASGHPGRRNIGVEIVRQGLAKADASVVAGPSSMGEPFDVLFALFTGQRREELIAWAEGTSGPTWLRTFVVAQLGSDE